MQRKLAIGVILALFTAPAAAQDYYSNDNSNSNEYEQPTRPTGGYYNEYSPGYGSGWQGYTNGHSCFTSTVNGYSVTNCN